MHSALSPSQFEFCLRCELQRVYRCCYNQITLYIFSMFYKRLDDENKRNFFSSHETGMHSETIVDVSQPP